MRLALALTLALISPAVAALRQDPKLGEHYHELAEKGDRAALVALWRGEPGSVLATIDEDLEGSLALTEKARKAGKEPDAAAVAAMRARARFGAEAADEAFGTALFTDYAVAFASFTEEEAKSFRAGQAAYGRARAAFKAGDNGAALEAATESEALARPLGDWWGAAMAAGARGQALVALGRAEEGLGALAEAALLNHDLRLLGAEYQTLRMLADALDGAGKKERAQRALERAAALAETLGDKEGLKALKARLAGSK